MDTEVEFKVGDYIRRWDKQIDWVSEKHDTGGYLVLAVNHLGNPIIKDDDGDIFARCADRFELVSSAPPVADIRDPELDRVAEDMISDVVIDPMAALDLSVGTKADNGKTRFDLVPVDTVADNDVSSQPHYADFAIEPLEFIERNGLAFWAGNVIKYVCRWDKKGEGVKDLYKARDYLDKKIALLEGRPDWIRGTSR